MPAAALRDSGEPADVEVRLAGGAIGEQRPVVQLRPRRAVELALRSGRLATTHHSFLGSFSAVSKRNFATKYAIFQIFDFFFEIYKTI